MTAEIFARNILVLNQLEEIAIEFTKAHITFALLKGIALVNIFPEYLNCRQMEDIDILVKHGQIEKAKQILCSIGYKKSKFDPYAFWRENTPAYVDLSDGLWYLNKKENLELLFNANTIPIVGSNIFVKVLSCEDLYINILTHAYIHHTEPDDRWLSDLKLMENNWTDKLNLCELKLKCRNYGISVDIMRKGLEQNIMNTVKRSSILKHKGHILRFMFLPFLRKLVYLFNTLFPNTKFLVDRYDLKSFWEIILWRIFRPVDLLIKCFY